MAGSQFSQTVLDGTQRGLQVAASAPLCLWYRTEEPDGAVYTEYQGQDRMLRRPLSMQKEELQQAACVELAQVVLAISGHEGRQDAVHIISGQGWRLS